MQTSDKKNRIFLCIFVFYSIPDCVEVTFTRKNSKKIWFFTRLFVTLHL